MTAASSVSRTGSPRSGSRLRTLSLLAALLVPGTGALAQQTGQVTGRVTNASTSQPIAVAQVSVDGTSIGAVTSENGRFLLQAVPGGSHELVVQRIGFRTERRQIEVAEGEATVVDVELTETAIELDEVVATGTAGAASRRELGNSVGTVQPDNLQAQPAVGLTEALYGQATGLQIHQPEGQVGGGSRILLRGMNSVTQDAQPLIYVDGVRMNNNQGIFGNRQGQNPGPDGAQTSPNPLDDLNPDDIERVEIIRGSAATTMYGTEAAGGVIQIFTKSGQSGQAATWTLRSTAGTRFMHGNNLGPVIGETDDWGLLKPWLSTFTDPAPLGQVDLSVRGGTETLRYFFSGGLDYDDGVVPNNDSRRASVRGNFGFTPHQALRIDVNSSYSNRENSYVESGDNTYGFMLNVLRGDQDYTNAAVPQGFEGDPDQLVFDIDNLGTNEHFVGGVTVTHTPSAVDLTTSLTLGLDYTSAFNRQTIPFDFPLLERGQRDVSRWEHRTITAEATSTWTADVNERIGSRLSIGGQIFNDWDHTVFGFSEDFGGPGAKTLSSGATRRSDERLLQVINAGVFVQEVLDYEDVFFVTGGLRVDGNSAFGTDLGLQAYPKASFSYVASDHLELPDWWDVLKLRAAWGQSGKAPGAFDAVRTWSPISGYEGQSGVSPANLGNPELGPERGSELEAGFESSLFTDRIGVDFTWYRSVTKDALLPVPQPPSKGFLSAQLRNVGEFENRGIELSVTGVPVRTRDVQWSLTGRLSTNHSEVLSLGESPEFFLGFGSILGQWVKEGHDLVSLWGQQVLNPNELADPVVSDTARYYGPVYPTETLSLETRLNLFNSLTLRATGQGSFGHYQFNIMPWQQVRRGLWPECTDRQPIEEAEAIWRARCAEPTPNFDFWMRPADFFKLRNVSVSYELPEGAIPGASSPSLTLSGHNLWKWQRAIGLDPELNRDSVFPARYEYYQMPAPSMISVTLRANF